MIIDITFETIYDWKRDSYQPKDRLSTIWLTSAPKRAFSRSVDETPSFKGMNLFSFVMAICIGMRHNKSTSHSPARNSLRAPCIVENMSENVVEVTNIFLSMSPAGLRVLLSNVWIMSEKWDENSW